MCNIVEKAIEWDIPVFVLDGDPLKAYDYTDNNDDSVNDIELEYRVYFVTDGDEILDGTYSLWRLTLIM